MIIPQFSLAGFLTSISTFFLALFVFVRNRKSRLTKIFVLYSLSIAEWSFFTALHAMTTSETLSFLSARAMHLGVPLIPILFFHFSLDILSLYEKHKKKLFFGYILCFLFVVTNFFTPFIVPRVVPKLGYHFFMDGGVLYPVLIVYFVSFTALGLSLLLKAYHSSSGNRRNQLKYLFWGSILGYIFGPSCFLPVYNITIFPYPYGSFAIVVYVLMTAYAIFKYRLMDIRVMAIRTIVFSIVYIPLLMLPFIAGIKFKDFLEHFFRINWWIVPVILANIFAPLGIYIYLRLKNRAEEIMLYEQRRYQATLLQISQGMTLIKEIDRLLSLIVHVVSRAIHLKDVSIFLLDKEQAIYNLKVTRYKSRTPKGISLQADDIIVLQLMRGRAPIVLEEIRSRLSENNNGAGDAEDLKEIEIRMKELNVAVVIPSFIHEVLLGFITLGEKLNGQMYTQDDLNVFGVLANHAALAIENAIFYEEQGKTLAQKFHEHKIWSIGKMGSNIGHQINNRFQSLVYAADAARLMYVPKIKKNLTEPEAIEHMGKLEEALQIFVDDAMRGSEIAVALTNFSRKSQDFKPIALENAIKGALNLLSCKFKVEELNLVTEISEAKSMILGNLAILQDIFMNILDNAHDAETMKKQKIEKGELSVNGSYQILTRIKAGLDPNRTKWVIDVEDNGIGMTEEELKQMFIPFFTTKATTEKGTGLGMSIIKQMIDAHKGTINIFSKYGEGSKITLTLPIAYESNERTS